MGELRRTHAAAEVSADLVDREVVLAGWVHRRRDHGGVIFVDLRDRGERVQVVFRPDASPEAHARAGELRSEYVILVRGVVMRRSADTVNPKLATGEVEVEVSELRLLNRATPPPFAIEEEADADEEARLRYRLHDLRRPPLQRALQLRHALAQSVRSSLVAQGFLEIETPVLANSTPEGARDFLVPSRLHPGEFYALPQSPQIMKQLLMIAGFERYFQIARCFRDEDLRADRQPEFTQIDLEMSFVGVEEVLDVLEELTARGCAEAAGVELERPFRRIPYIEAMDRFGSDRPDTRIQLELVDLTDAFRESGFRAFRAAVDAGGIVKCLPVHDAGDLGRGDVDRLESFVKKELGAKGLAWIRVNDDGTWQSPIVKFFSEEERAMVAERTGARPGSLIFFQADAAGRANAVLSRLRTDLGERLGRVDGRAFDAVFVVDFPLFKRADDGSRTYAHQPFVAPLDEDLGLLETDPDRVRGTHYDVVINGVELGSGSLRNHRSDVQRRILELLGYPKREAETRFGFLLNALDAGAPPHGGFAYGFDRWVMVLAGVESLRDVVAFPKTQRAQDLLMNAPGVVEQQQLDELTIRVELPRE
ncbi:MAG: aspartate--tRNA ligase [Myxococcota bacterium]|nr:aspartate--tRNA ligase [Deltaproteobacteria bacterium]MCP4244136.1 aspartate--tRNA ligase [bacterium]MDP6076247.1 aspartate--tRNA ligase [Myxococcota bacterium]MDP7074953.1 aspartate--tRNA ligase [Myxococcota bacterium]MDP7298997.1 aspartate--tRNA ligase [Myxococcota bacterium]